MKYFQGPERERATFSRGYQPLNNVWLLVELLIDQPMDHKRSATIARGQNYYSKIIYDLFENFCDNSQERISNFELDA